jgi:serine protease Do
MPSPVRWHPLGGGYTKPIGSGCAGLGIGTSVSTGVVSGLDRNLMRTPFDDYIQTDATINPGNSGGPLIDCAGNIIGINTVLISNSKTLGSIGLGFALPSNDIRFATDRLRGQAPTEPNWIGVHLQDLTARLAEVFGRPAVTGGIVTVRIPDELAARLAAEGGGSMQTCGVHYAAAGVASSLLARRKPG